MSERTRRRTFSLAILILLCFFASRAAIAQSPKSSANDRSEKLLAQPNLSPLPSRQARRSGDVWVPPDIDTLVPAVAPGPACSLPDVTARAGRRIQELVQNLDRFTATEVVEHHGVDRGGKLGRVQSRKFDYLVSIAPGRGGYLKVNEYRSHVKELEQFPAQIATEGTPSLVLVFHPAYARDFQMNCEGLGEWKGKPAWQVRFEQRADHSNHMSSLLVGGQAFSIGLRGRGWILADSYQVARLETDLVETIPKIRLRLEHMNVEYAPVAFPGRGVELWLPSVTELYLDFLGRRFYRRHTFTGFTLFSVQIHQQYGGADQ